MKQLFKAVCSLNNEMSWLFFDGEGKSSIVAGRIFSSSDKAIEAFKSSGAIFAEDAEDRDSMINPELVAEWE